MSFLLDGGPLTTVTDKVDQYRTKLPVLPLAWTVSPFLSVLCRAQLAKSTQRSLVSFTPPSFAIFLNNED